MAHIKKTEMTEQAPGPAAEGVVDVGLPESKTNDCTGQLVSLVTRHPELAKIDGGDLYRELYSAVIDPWCAREKAIGWFAGVVGDNQWLLEPPFRYALRRITGYIMPGKAWERAQLSKLLAAYPGNEKGDPRILDRFFGVLACIDLDSSITEVSLTERLTVMDLLGPGIEKAARGNGAGNVIDEAMVRHPWMAEPRSLAASVSIARIIMDCASRSRDLREDAERIISFFERNFNVTDTHGSEGIERTCGFIHRNTKYYLNYIDDILKALENYFMSCRHHPFLSDPRLIDAFIDSPRALYGSRNPVGYIKAIITMYESATKWSGASCGNDGKRFSAILVDPVRSAILHGINPVYICREFFAFADHLSRYGIPADERMMICEAVTVTVTELIRGRINAAGVFRALAALIDPYHVEPEETLTRVGECLDLLGPFTVNVRDAGSTPEKRDSCTVPTYILDSAHCTDFICLLIEAGAGFPGSDGLNALREYLDVYIGCLGTLSRIKGRINRPLVAGMVLCRLVASCPGYSNPGRAGDLARAADLLINRLAGFALRVECDDFLFGDVSRYITDLEEKSGIVPSVVKKYEDDRSLLAALVRAKPGLLEPGEVDRLTRFIEICVSAQEKAVAAGGLCIMVIVGMAKILRICPSILEGDAVGNLEAYAEIFMKCAMIELSKGTGNISDVADELIIDLCSAHPAIAEPRNLSTCKAVAELYFECIRRRFNPDYIHNRLLKPLFENEPSLALHENFERLSRVMRRIRRYMYRGMLPPRIESDETDLLSFHRRREEIARGFLPDHTVPSDLCLFYSVLFGKGRCGDNYLYFIEKLLPVALGRAIRSLHLSIGSAVLDGRGARRPCGDSASLGAVITFRDSILALHDDPRGLHREVDGLHQVGRRGRAYIHSALCAPRPPYRGIVSRLMSRQLSNYQPRVSSFIEKIIICAALQESPELRRALSSSDVAESLFALKGLLLHRTGELLDDILDAAFHRRLSSFIEEETGCRIRPDVYARACLREKIRILSRECDVSGHILGLAARLNDAASASPTFPGNGPLRIPIEVNAISRGEPLLLVDDFRINSKVVTLEVRRGVEGIDRTLHVVDYEGRFLSGRHELAVRDGMFTDSSKFRDSEEPMAAGLRSLQRPDPALLEKLSRNYHVIRDRVLPVLSPSSKETRMVIDAIDRSLQGYCPAAGFDGGLFFLPANDWTLCFRYAVSHDCSKDMAGHVFHPSSFFFKIIDRDRWCGYLMLVELACASGGRALAIDVINVDTAKRIDWAGVMADFVDFLAPCAESHGYRYILISAEQKYLSNSDHISLPIHRCFGNRRILPRGEFTLDPHDDSFQCLKGDFRVLWESV